MKIGQTVTYRSASGVVGTATITDVTESGPSGGKVLNLNLGPKDDVEGVPYFKDRIEGVPCWALKGETIPDDE